MPKRFPAVYKAYLNGEFVDPEQVTISPFDRGFIFGDGVYEVIPCYGGRVFRWPEHLARLNRNLSILGIPEPLDRAQWSALVEDLILGLEDRDLYLYIQVTRGIAPRDHLFPAAEPTVFAYSNDLPAVETELLTRGISAVTRADLRWQRCDLKTVSLVGNVWLRQQAQDAGAAEAILLRDGQVTEGSATNVFVVIDGEVRTPPLGPALLPGITRELVVELMQRFGVRHRERNISDAELQAATEVWISSSTRELLPVTRIDGQPVGDGMPGAVFQRVYDLFQQYKRECRAGATA